MIDLLMTLGGAAGLFALGYYGASIAHRHIRRW